MMPSRQIIAFNCIIVWLLFLGLTVLQLPNTSLGKLLAVSSVILASHIIYAGYFLLVRLPKLDTLIITAACIVVANLILSPFFLKNYLALSANFVILFLAAMVLHRHVLSLRISQRLDRLASYKLRLEICIIGFITIQSLLLWSFGHYRSLTAFTGLIILVLADGVIILWHQIYRD